MVFCPMDQANDATVNSQLVLRKPCYLSRIGRVVGVARSPIQFVREYYGDEIAYPPPEGQTDEWKDFQASLYVLMARSTCLAYPMATAKGIVSFSDMQQDFDWAKYDMESKSRNSDIVANDCIPSG